MSLVAEDRIRALATVQSSSAPVVTCYLDVDGRRFPRKQDLEGELDRLVRSAGEAAAGAGADVERIQQHVRAGFDRSRTRGLAVFACGSQDLWEVVELPVPVRSQLVFASAPALGQLESVVEEHGSLAVLLADRKHARIFLFEMGELVERSELVGEGDLGRDWDEKGGKERGDHQHHVDDLAHRHLRRAAEATWALFKEREFACLTLGVPDHEASMLEGALHPTLKARLAPPIKVAVSASPQEVRTAALDVEAAVEREHEAERVAALRDAVATGRGAAGLADVLAALNERRAELLLVSDGYEEEGWRCERCDILTAVGRTCPVCDAEMQAVGDVVQAAVDVALGQSCQVDVCVGNADLDVLGRVGARLRY
jgi:peptide subunit release factor 1 (eRF1)